MASSAERLTITIEQAAEALGISRSSAYEAFHRGQIPIVRVGRRRLLVPKRALQRMLEGTAPEGEDSTGRG